MHLAIGCTYAAMICCEKLKTLPETSDEKTKEVNRFFENFHVALLSFSFTFLGQSSNKLVKRPHRPRPSTSLS